MVPALVVLDAGLVVVAVVVAAVVNPAVPAVRPALLLLPQDF